MNRTLLRWLFFALTVTCALAWLASLSFFLASPTSTTNFPLQLNATGWRDTLSFELKLSDWGAQPRRGALVWTSGAREYRYPLVAPADGQFHSYFVPLGGEQGWQGQNLTLRVQFLSADDLMPETRNVALVERIPFAFDVWVRQAFAPLLPTTPPFPNVLLLVAAFFILALALAFPRGEWKHRLMWGAITLGALAGIFTFGAVIQNTLVIWNAYQGLTEPQAQQRALSYDDSPRVNVALVQAENTLGAQPVLLLDTANSGTVTDRARYLLYPRRVNVLTPRPTPANLIAQLKNYGAVIQSPGAPMPAPQWERVSASNAPIAIWRAPNSTAPAPLPLPGPLAPLEIALALGVLWFAGWSVSGIFGWRGGVRAGAAFLVGITLLAVWMFVLDLLRLGWSWWTIAIPLLVLSLLGAWRANRPSRSPDIIIGKSSKVYTRLRAQNLTGWHIALILLFSILLLCIAIQATLLPMNDIDTWRVWGMRGRAFFLDGNLEGVLRTYGSLVTPGYPPAQPLAQTWLYLAMGGLDERAVKIIFPIFYLVTCALTFFTLRAWCNTARALAWTLLLATTPVLLDHATLTNADLPFAAALLLSANALCTWLEQGERKWLFAAVLALGGAAWLKFDGAYFGVIMLAITVLLRARIEMPRTTKSAWHLNSVLRDGLFSLVAFLLFVLVWNFYTRVVLGLSEPTTFAGAWGWERVLTFLRGGQEILEELVFSRSNSAWGWLGGGYGAFWFIVLGALLIKWRRIGRDPLVWFLLLSAGAGILFYLAIYTVRPFFSSERYLLHIAPLVLLAAARVTRPDGEIKKAAQRVRGNPPSRGESLSSS